MTMTDENTTVGGTPLLDPTAQSGAPSRSVTGFYRRGGKRLFDLIVAVPVALLLLPVLGTVAVLLRVSLGPGILLRQERIGRHGHTFPMYKFRTMEPSRRSQEEPFDGEDRRQTHKDPTDPRHTRIGRLCRTFSLDELPQLVNVLRGHMSLVGPRPELADIADDTFRRHHRHRVAPGLTGPFQLSPLRSSGELRSGLHLDAAYVDQLSFVRDVRYLLGTIRAIVRGTGT